MIAFPCSHCGKGLKVKEELAGKRGRCPHCKRAFRVPGAPISVPAVLPGSPEHPLADLPTLPPQTPVPGARAGETLPPPWPRLAGVGETIAPRGDTAPVATELFDFLSPAQTPDEIGRLGPYRILKVIGSGGMGVVFQAEDPQLKRIVALKAMLPALAASPANRERFLREAQTAAAIEHDHIVTILQVGEDRGVPFLAMPFLRGEMLEDRIKRQSRFPAAEVLRIGRETAQGLAAAHARGLMHRDIKPANIWLEEERGRVKILDFGLARAAGQDSHLTQQGAIVGTPAYMAPEQARGQTVDARCDLFSLGCVLYQLCSGRLPFVGTDAISTLMAVATEHPPAPSQLNPSVPPEMSGLVMQLLAKDPAARPSSAIAVIAEIEAMERGERKVAPAVPSNARVLEVEAVDEDDPSELLPIAEPYEEVRGGGLVRLWPWFAGAGGLLVVVLLVATVIVIRSRTKPGAVTLDIDQTGVEITLDGQRMPREATTNKGAVQFEVPAGKHEMRVTKEGFEPYTVQFSMESGGAEELRVRLEPKHDRGIVINQPPRPNSNPIPPDSPRPPKSDAVAPFRTIPVDGARGHWVASAVDGKHFATRQDNGIVRYWDADKGTVLAEFDLKGKGGGHAVMSADGKKLAAYTGTTLKVWDVDLQKELDTTTSNAGVYVLGVTFTNDNRTLVTLCGTIGAAKGLIQIYDLDTKKEIARLSGHASLIRWVLVTPDGSRVLSSSDDKTLRIWDVDGAREVFQLASQDRPAKCMALSPDGKRALTSHHNGEIHVWDLVNGTETRVLKGEGGHSGEVDAVAFTPDGRLALSGGFDSIIHVWDLRTGKIIGRLQGESIIVSLAVSPDGDAVFAGAFGGKLLCFKMPKQW